MKCQGAHEVEDLEPGVPHAEFGHGAVADLKPHGGSARGRGHTAPYGSSTKQSALVECRK